MFNFFKALLCLLGTFAFFLFTACAPSLPPPEVSDADAGQEAEQTQPAPTRASDIRVENGSRPRESASDIAAAPERVRPPEATFDPRNPDWNLRARMLYDHYLANFEAPVPGQTVELTLASGRAQQGVLESLDENQLILQIASGSMTLTPESLNETSRARFFARDYARLNALRQGRSEYAQWQQAQEQARRPTPQPRQERPAQTARVDYTRPAHRVNPNAEPPKNEGPAGRVSHVDQYIRQNAAVPHSLRIESWGRVQPDGEGYKVRVRYSLQGAEGFGRTDEDMVFFMHADGTVYRRAPYRGN
ncbi:MAG: hypothetical protein JJU29_20295 [Verrucomicrobia bacterium]|nr:hypothetical protein [Verrucomicrobiota bacterium]MCH8510107.1 hypothetical protein [Kiritimatiellia bacterium]